MFNHISVMLNECIEGLDIKPDGIYVDGTLGGAGHSIHIAEKLVNGKLIGIDKDLDALSHSGEKLKSFGDRINLIHSDFKDIPKVLDSLEIDRVDGILLDLGVSSYQIDTAERGFSYNNDGALDMRMDRTKGFSAFDVVNCYTEKELADIIFRYGEDKFGRQIARNIVKEREKAPIETTAQLVKIVENSVPAKFRWENGNPAKKTFQAIRIEVNSELKDLDTAIYEMVKRLKIGGRMCVLTFHSLEDRVVKQVFRYLALDCICPPQQPICTCKKNSSVKILTRKPAIATKEELQINKRATSAKLRIIEKQKEV